MSRKRRDRLVKDRPIESPKLRDIELIAMLKQLEVLAQAANLPPELMDRVSGEISQKIAKAG